MSALSITAANVQPASNAVILSGTFGATITAGQVVYELSSDNEWYLADADVLATSVVAGIAINGGSDGQAGDIQIVGDIDLGATLTVGQIYVLSTTAGGIAPTVDTASGDYVTVLGVATAADSMMMEILISNTAEP